MASDQIKVTFRVKIGIDSETEAYMRGIADALTKLGESLQRQGERFQGAIENLKEDGILDEPEAGPVP